MSVILKDEAQLRQVSQPVKDVKEGGAIARQLTAALQRHNKRARKSYRKIEVAKGMVPGIPMGLGLSAPQIGIFKQVAIICINEGPAIVMMNPVIIEHSKERIPVKEGCLSFPGREEFVYRWPWVVVQCLNRPEPLRLGPAVPEDWSHPTKLLKAVVCQHEYDHLQGVLFFDKVSINEAA